MVISSQGSPVSILMITYEVLNMKMKIMKLKFPAAFCKPKLLYKYFPVKEHLINKATINYNKRIVHEINYSS